MEKAVFGMDVLRITQGMNGSFSHQGSLAIDIGGKDGGIDSMRAPFTGTIKRIYEGYCVWLESNEKVKYADGTEDYMTVLSMHDNDTSDLYVGKVIKQGQVYFQEGTKGYATGNHIHLTVGKGKFTGNGWSKNSYGNWDVNNQYDITKALFLHKDCVRKEDFGYAWKTTNDYIYNSVIPNVNRDEYRDQVQILIDNLRVRTDAGTDKGILGYAGKGYYNVLDKKDASGYTWFKIAEGQWLATNEGWTKYLEHKEPTKRYLNLHPEADTWTTYKTNKYFMPSKKEDVLAILKPSKFGGLSYEILDDCGNYHFKIRTQQFGEGWISGNINKYPCSITNSPKYQ